MPTERTKGVLVFPTLDGKVIAGPTAVDQEDKDDWSVRPRPRTRSIRKAVAMWPPLEGAEPIAAYAGLRPAGPGVNYLIGPRRGAAGLVNVAAIRSTGLTASLGHRRARGGGSSRGWASRSAERPLEPAPLRRLAVPWWQRAAERRAA